MTLWLCARKRISRSAAEVLRRRKIKKLIFIAKLICIGYTNNMKTLNVRLDDWTHKNLKALAALRETTIAELLKMLVGKEIEENPQECELCRKFGHEPNETTRKAMADKGGKSFKSIKALMEDLQSD